MIACSAQAFYSQAGKELDAPLDYPVDKFHEKATVKPHSFKKQMHPYKVRLPAHSQQFICSRGCSLFNQAFMEATLGKQMTGMEVQATQKFLKNDGKVLRFYCQWDDKNMFGEKRPYVSALLAPSTSSLTLSPFCSQILHYFLADDTVEVLEVHQQVRGFVI